MMGLIGFMELIELYHKQKREKNEIMSVIELNFVQIT